MTVPRAFDPVRLTPTLIRGKCKSFAKVSAAAAALAGPAQTSPAAREWRARINVASPAQAVRLGNFFHDAGVDRATLVRRQLGAQWRRVFAPPVHPGERRVRLGDELAHDLADRKDLFDAARGLPGRQQ